MKEGKAIRDTQVKAIKTVLKESNFELKQVDNAAYSELDKAVVKIVNVRKYKSGWGSSFLYEFDVVVDMRSDSGYYIYTNRYCEKYKVRCNGYYRNKIKKIIANEIKYFGVDTHYDDVYIKKITYKEIV
jgi:hypothetical protein